MLLAHWGEFWKVFRRFPSAPSALLPQTAPLTDPRNGLVWRRYSRASRATPAMSGTPPLSQGGPSPIQPGLGIPVWSHAGPGVGLNDLCGSLPPQGIPKSFSDIYLLASITPSCCLKLFCSQGDKFCWPWAALWWHSSSCNNSGNALPRIKQPINIISKTNRRSRQRQKAASFPLGFIKIGIKFFWICTLMEKQKY